MLARLHQNLGTAGLVVAIIALVAALGGGAYAATGGPTGGKATASAKAKKGPRGPKGATGPAGPAGPKGDAGAAGAAGAKGDTGAAGTNGTNGSNGVSVTTSAATEAECGKAGGVKLTSASGNTKVCNGTTGFTKTLPVGQTETGTWSVTQTESAVEAGITSPISFSIPLPKSVEAVYLNEEETRNEAETGGCKWEQENLDATPQAPQGKLCVFTQEETKSNAVGFSHVIAPGQPGAFGFAGPSGAYLEFEVNGNPTNARLHEFGAWAVTAG